MPIYISATGIKDYIKCEKRIWFRREMPEAAEETKELSYGKLVHNALHHAWRSKDEFMTYIVNHVQRNDLDTDFIKKAGATADSVFNPYSGFTHLLTEEDRIEFEFKIKLYRDVYLVGRIDRINSNGILIDWKTGKSYSKNLSNDPQFIIYHDVYNRLMRKNPNSTYLCAVDTGETVEYEPIDFYKKVLYNEIIPDMVKKIRTDTLSYNGIFNSACYRCSFRDICIGRSGLNVVDS